MPLEAGVVIGGVRVLLIGVSWVGALSGAGGLLATSSVLGTSVGTGEGGAPIGESRVGVVVAELATLGGAVTKGFGANLFKMDSNFALVAAESVRVVGNSTEIRLGFFIC